MTRRARAVGLVLLVLLGACGRDEVLLRSQAGAVADAGPRPSGQPSGAQRAKLPPSSGHVEFPFGRSCSGDADCEGDSVCLRAEGYLFYEGGPAGGYCSLPCSSDEGCQVADPKALCVPVLGLEAAGYCMLGCIPGDSASGPEKCRGRPDLACDSLPLSDGSLRGFCRPLCLSDQHCPMGRVCHLGTGVCVDAALRPPGAPIGAPCSPESGGLDAACTHDVCLVYSEDYAICSGYCNTALVGCGSDSVEPESAPGAPACQNVFRNSGNGDVGRCGQRCHCTADCTHPKASCWVRAGSEEGGTQRLGARGLCVSPGYVASNPDETYAEDCEPAQR